MKISKDNYKEYFDGRTLVLPPETSEIAEMAVFGSDRLVTLDLSNVTSFPVVIGKRAFMRCASSDMTTGGCRPISRTVSGCRVSVSRQNWPTSGANSSCSDTTDS